MAIGGLAVNLIRRGPVTAWQTYRPQTHRPWLDHLISDRFPAGKSWTAAVRRYFPAAAVRS